MHQCSVILCLLFHSVTSQISNKRWFLFFFFFLFTIFFMDKLVASYSLLPLASPLSVSVSRFYLLWPLSMLIHNYIISYTFLAQPKPLISNFNCDVVHFRDPPPPFASFHVISCHVSFHSALLLWSQYQRKNIIHSVSIKHLHNLSLPQLTSGLFSCVDVLWIPLVILLISICCVRCIPHIVCQFYRAPWLLFIGRHFRVMWSVKMGLKDRNHIWLCQCCLWSAINQWM